MVQMRDRMDELEKKIDNMKISEEEKEQLKEALAARRRILRFNDDHMRTRKAICFNYLTGEKVGEIL